MQFTSTEVIAIIVAMGGFVAGVGSVIVNIIIAGKTGNRMSEVLTSNHSIAQVTARSLVETGNLQTKVQEVHVLTNQNLSDVRNELKTSNAELASLREVIADLKGEREKTNIRTAYQTPVPAAPQATSLRRVTDAIPVKADLPIPVKIIAEEPVPVDIHEHVENKPSKK